MKATTATDWTSKYRPQNLEGVLGNPTAVAALRQWAQAWRQGPPDKRALILAGDPGVGKTTAAHALARDYGWTLIELNASDARNARAIENVALRGALYDSFGTDGSFQRAAQGGRKLIILDEADSLVERVEGGRKLEKDLSDRGGKPAIVRTLRQTAQPIILIVNDLYALTKGSGGPLRSLARVVKFQRLRRPTMKALLQKVCQAEGVAAEPEALQELAAQAGGDLRAALNDLQGLAEAGPVTLERVQWLSSRDKQKELFELLAVIFRAMDYATPRETAWQVEENPEAIALWVDDNLPLAYTDPFDLQRGYEALSRADSYLGRVRRRQYYGYWAYASDLATSGVALAKKRPPTSRPRYQFPSWLRRMAASRGKRAVRKSTLSALARHCHTSTGVALTDLYPLFQTLLAQPFESEPPETNTTPAPGPQLVADLKLEGPQLAYLLSTKADDPQVVALLEAAASLGWGPMEKLRGRKAREALAGANLARSEGDRPQSKSRPAQDSPAVEEAGGAEREPSEGDSDESPEPGASPKPDRAQKTLFEF